MTTTTSQARTIRTEPDFLTVEDWRAIGKHNRILGKVNFTFFTDETWLPHFLVEQEFAPSTSEIRRNRKDLWRDIKPWDHFTFSWANILIVRR